MLDGFLKRFMLIFSLLKRSVTKLMWFFLLLFTFISVPAQLSANDDLPFVAIVVDDLGDNYSRGLRAVKLPGDVTYSILPHTPYSKNLAARINRSGREVMLHLPMQPLGEENMGPGGLHHTMSKSQFIKTVRNNIASIPYIAGINNHMGSLLTQQSIQMNWLMDELNENNDFYFVDSYTHAGSVAFRTAQRLNVPSATRDIFLDHVIEAGEIDKQFLRLIKRARIFGSALGIAHPHMETLLALEYWIPQLAAEGIELVPVSQYIELKNQRNPTWQASLSLSRKAAKN